MISNIDVSCLQLSGICQPSVPDTQLLQQPIIESAGLWSNNSLFRFCTMLILPEPHQDVEMGQLAILEVSGPSALVLTLLWKQKHHHHHRRKVKVNGFSVPNIIHPPSFLVQQAWPRLEQKLLTMYLKCDVLFVGVGVWWEPCAVVSCCCSQSLLAWGQLDQSRFSLSTIKPPWCMWAP